MNELDQAVLAHRENPTDASHDRRRTHEYIVPDMRTTHEFLISGCRYQWVAGHDHDDCWRAFMRHNNRPESTTSREFYER